MGAFEGRYGVREITQAKIGSKGNVDVVRRNE
jgi:hypothetical protein